MGISPLDFEYIRNLVYLHSAIVLEPEKEYLVNSRLTQLSSKLGMNSLEELLVRLKAKPTDVHLQDLVLEAMMTHETLFFRDIYLFEVLRTTLLPQIIKNRAAERQINIWSAACSTGQEIYSFAMLLREHFPQLLTDWKINLIASDLSDQALAQAKQAEYSQFEINRGLPTSLLVKYFEQKKLGWKIKAAISQMVEFRKISLIQTFPPLPQMDIILLRYVLVYFDTKTKKEVLERVRHQLKPDGILCLGGPETVLNLDASFYMTQTEKVVYYRKNP